MSMRKSLYRQSLLRNANSNSNSSTSLSQFQDIQEINLTNGSKQWVRDWYAPLKSNVQQQQQVASGLPGSTGSSVPPSGLMTPIENNNDLSSQTPQPQQSYNFKVKTWVPYISSQSSSTKDCEDDESIDLDDYLYIPRNSNDESSGSNDMANGENGLSEADIRGAVGGVNGGSSLFSSSAAVEMKEKEKKQEEQEQEEQEKEPEQQQEEVKKIEEIDESSSDPKDVDMEVSEPTSATPVEQSEVVSEVATTEAEATPVESSIEASTEPTPAEPSTEPSAVDTDGDVQMEQ